MMYFLYTLETFFLPEILTTLTIPINMKGISHVYNSRFKKMPNPTNIRVCICTQYKMLIKEFLKISMWAYNLMVNNIVRSNYIFVENNKIEILFSNYTFGLTFQSPSSK